MVFKNPEKEIENYQRLVEPAKDALSALENACRDYSKAQGLIQNLKMIKDEDRNTLKTTTERQITDKEKEIDDLEKRVYVAGSIIESVDAKNKDKRKMTDELEDLKYGLELFANPDKKLAELNGDVSSYATIIKENLAELDRYISKMKKCSGKFKAEKNLNARINGDITEITETVKGLSKNNVFILTLCGDMNFKGLEFYNHSEDLVKC